MDAAPERGPLGRVQRVSKETRFVVAAAAAIGLMIAAAAWVTFISTTAADPIGQSGLGVRPGLQLHVRAVGREVALTSYLFGDSPTSQAQFTGATVPQVNGLRIGVYAVRGRPVGQGGFTVSAGGGTGELAPTRLVPIAGTTLRPAPSSLDTNGAPYTTIAIVLTPLRPGCFSFSGVTVHYRFGDSEFAKTMPGTDTIATPGSSCG